MLFHKSGHLSDVVPTPEFVASANVSYSCVECGKSFPRRDYLSQHMQLHKPPKFQCKMCGKKFRWLMSYKRHTKICKSPFMQWIPGQNPND